MLTFSEETLLLLLDDEKGTFFPIPQSTLGCAMAGAVLMDLAFAARVDTDLEHLTVIDANLTGDPTLDYIHEILIRSTKVQKIQYWIETLSQEHSDNIRDNALASLVRKNILKVSEEKILWVFKTRRYPMIDGHAEREAKLRIVSVLLSDDLPNPRDIALISLVNTCDLLGTILSQHEVNLAATRIEQLQKMNIIGQKIALAIADIDTSIAIAVAQTHYPYY